MGDRVMRSLFTAGLLTVLLATLLAACHPSPAGTVPPSAPPPTATRTPTATPSPTPTFTPTATPTPSPTPGPGLETLLQTPDELVRAVALEEAVGAYEELAALYPQRAEPRLRLAALAQREGDPEAALVHLWAAVEADPGSMEALRQLALLLDQEGEYEDLVDVYGRMLALTPDDADLLIARAMTNARLGKAGAAVADLEGAQSMAPYREYAWVNAAGAASGSRQYRAAIEIAAAGLAANPDLAGLLLARGEAHLSLDEPEEALVDFEAAVALDAYSFAAYHWRGRTLVALGRYEEAVEDLQRAADLGVLSGVSGVYDAYGAMADAADALARSDPQAAFTYLAQQVFRYGSRDPLLLGYARVDWRRGNVSLALSRLDNLVDAGYVPALFWRGQIHAEEGQVGEAIADLEAYLAVRRSGPDAETARRLLESLGGSAGGRE
jgi:tetratricopeptide (TPR) repeat protein